MKSLFRDLWQLLFPSLCAACRQPLYRNENVFCLHCIYQLPYTDHHLFEANKTAKKLWGRMEFKAAISLLHFRKGGTVQSLIHQLKYKGRQDLGLKLGEMIAERLKLAARFQQIDLIIPVPLHPQKQRKRGYNQSFCIATGIARQIKVPIASDNLIRTKQTKSQTTKNRYDRAKSMAGVFELKRPRLLSGKHILLVDDVITTGATIEACASALHQAGIANLLIVAAAFAD